MGYCAVYACGRHWWNRCFWTAAFGIFLHTHMCFFCVQMCTLICILQYRLFAERIYHHVLGKLWDWWEHLLISPWGVMGGIQALSAACIDCDTALSSQLTLTGSTLFSQEILLFFAYLLLYITVTENKARGVFKSKLQLQNTLNSLLPEAWKTIGLCPGSVSGVGKPAGPYYLWV